MLKSTVVVAFALGLGAASAGYAGQSRSTGQATA